jgi:creatinine amidohydrolase/Fe(II)-dependent formamide hydrolase-like protein
MRKRAWLLWLLFLPSLSCAKAPGGVAKAPGVFIEDLTWTEVRDAIASGRKRAIFYAGSTEQNGPHMATGKHNVVARYVARRIAERLGDALVYPIMPFAPTGDSEARTGHMKFPGSVHVSDAVFGAVAREVAASALAAGFTSVFLMGDHGGGQKTLKQVAAELDSQWSGRGARVFYVEALYYESGQRATDYLKERKLDPGGHAGVLDTSELMYVDRKHVRRERITAGSDENGVDGDPAGASSELGRKFIEYKIDSAVRQMRALSKAKQ